MRSKLLLAVFDAAKLGYITQEDVHAALLEVYK
jgi:hypothetical protein